MSPVLLLKDVLIVVLAISAQADASDAQGSTDNKTGTLSVAPLDQVTYPSSRPSWVEEESIEDQVVIRTRLHRTEAAAEDEFVALVRGYISDDLEQLSHQTDMVFYEINDATILKDFVVESYQGTAVKGGDTLYEMAGQFVFPEEHRQAAVKAWSNSLVGDRMFFVAMTGGGLTVSMLLLTSVLNGLANRRQRTSAPAT